MKGSSLLATVSAASKVLALLGLVASIATAGDDFFVTGATGHDEDYQDVALDEGGGFFIVWTSRPGWPGSSRVLGRRYDSDGKPADGGHQIVDSEHGEQQSSARVCHRDGGGWAVIWHNTPSYVDPTLDPLNREGVFAQFLSEDGAPAGDAFRVSSANPAYQGYNLDVGCLPGGGFFAAWGSSAQDGSYYGVFGQYVDGAGNLVGAEIQVNTDTEGDQGNFGGVGVATSRAGKVLVLWSSNCPTYASGTASCPVQPDGSGSSAQARLFAENGSPSGPEFRVNTTTLGSQGSSGLAAAFDDDEGFIIVFSSGDVDIAPCYDWTPCGDLLAQYYDAAGARVGGEMLVNSSVRGDQSRPDVAYDGAGGYLVVWQHRLGNPSASVLTLGGRHFGPGGVPSGSDFVVTSNAPRDDRAPSITSWAGNYVVAWTTFRGIAARHGVLARQLSSNLPVCPATPDKGCSNPDDSVISVRAGGTRPSKLVWKWSAERSTASLAPNGGMTGYVLCIYDGIGTLVSTTGAAPFGDCDGDCWRGRNGRYRFRKLNGEAFQVRTLSVRNGRDRTKIRLKATGMGAPMARMQEMSAPLTAQLQISDGSCWEAVYSLVSKRLRGLKARLR